VKALTVQQPWAWAIVQGFKDVENRTTMWHYRGPLAIHAGTRWSVRGAHSPLIAGAHLDFMARNGWALAGDREKAIARSAAGGLAQHGPGDHRGAIIGTVNLVDIHVAERGCCDSPWAEYAYPDRLAGKVRADVTHLLLTDAVALPEPIPARGQLGMWTPNEHALHVLEDV
jgi:hypothetical protein